MRPPSLPAPLGPDPLPTALADLVGRCLAWDPAARPPDGAAVLAELDAIVVPSWPADAARACWTAMSMGEAPSPEHSDTLASPPPARM
jgi:hypothetical protein